MVNIFLAKMEDWSRITNLITTLSLIKKQLGTIIIHAIW